MNCLSTRKLMNKFGLSAYIVSPAPKGYKLHFGSWAIPLAQMSWKPAYPGISGLTLHFPCFQLPETEGLQLAVLWVCIIIIDGFALDAITLKRRDLPCIGRCGLAREVNGTKECWASSDAKASYAASVYGQRRWLGGPATATAATKAVAHYEYLRQHAFQGPWKADPVRPQIEPGRNRPTDVYFLYSFDLYQHSRTMTTASIVTAEKAAAINTASHVDQPPVWGQDGFSAALCDSEGIGKTITALTDSFHEFESSLVNLDASERQQVRYILRRISGLKMCLNRVYVIRHS